MFITLLFITFLVSLLTSFIVALLFKKAILKILNSVVSEELSPAIGKYIYFAIYVVGISGGIRIWDLEKYISPVYGQEITLTNERWVMEIFRTIIESLQSIAWMLLVFFLVSLIAYVIVKGFESKKAKINE